MIIQGKYYIFQRRANNFFHFGIKQCSAFLFLTCKTSLLPLIVQGGPSDWLAEKIILASLRYFLLPSLAQSPAKDSPASKKPKNRLHGADHVKQTKKNEGMNRETTSKVHKGQQGANPKMRMLVYRERSYPARKVQGRDGSYTVAADSLVPELLDGIRSLDPAAFKLDEEIACYCSDEEIQKLADEELVEIIYEWQRL